MGANNFGKLNLCNKSYTFGMDSEDEFEYEDTIENVVACLKQKDYFGETMRKWIQPNRMYYKIIGCFEVEYYNNERHFDGTIYGWDSNKYYIVVEPGYHEGARFDIIPDNSDYFTERFINKTYNKKLNKIIKDCEKVFAQYASNN